MVSKQDVYTEPSKVEAVEGNVELDGPDSVEVVLSPEAAEETSERLLSQSLKARGQRRLGKMAHRPKGG